MKTLQHIVIICASCSGNGAVANVALHQVHELAKCFRVTLASDGFPEKRDKNIHYVLIQSPKYTWLRRYSHVLREYAFTRHVKRELEVIHASDPIDLIISQSHPVTALTSKPLQKKYGIKSVLVTHGDIFDRPKGTYDPRLTWFYQKTTGPAYGSANLVIALSPYMREMAIKGGAAPEKVTVIPNGIDPNEIGLDYDRLPPQIPVDKKPLQLLYVGRLSIEKGVDILIEACGLLKKEGMDFQLRIAGDGPERVRLDDRIKALDLQVQIEFLGHVSRRELGDLYRSAHLVCVPSRSDPLPTVVLESLISGTPVIGSDVGGIPFMIEDRITGFLCTPDNSKSFATTLSSLVQKPDDLNKMRIACMDARRKRFSWRTTGKSLAAYLDDLV